jgi:hypothetical protein
MHRKILFSSLALAVLAAVSFPAVPAGALPSQVSPPPYAAPVRPARRVVGT